MQATTPTPTLAVVNAFTNKSHNTKSSDGIDQDKMATLEARIMAIEGVDLYDPVQPIKMSYPKYGCTKEVSCS